MGPVDEVDRAVRQELGRLRLPFRGKVNAIATNQGPFVFGPTNGSDPRRVVNLGYSEFLFSNSGGYANLASLSGVPAGIAGVAVIGDSGWGPMFND